jgi:hypothetical protein
MSEHYGEIVPRAEPSPPAAQPCPHGCETQAEHDSHQTAADPDDKALIARLRDRELRYVDLHLEAAARLESLMQERDYADEQALDRAEALGAALVERDTLAARVKVLEDERDTLLRKLSSFGDKHELGAKP